MGSDQNAVEIEGIEEEENEEVRVPDLDPALLVKVIETLKLIPPKQRLRTVESALTFLGTPHGGLVSGEVPRHGEPNFANVDRAEAAARLNTLPRRAQVWLTQSSLTYEQLGAVFHRTNDGVEIIAHDLPGISIKERVIQCYLLSGIRSFLEHGEPKFKDEVARGVCKVLGCFDPGNHSTYTKAIGNLMLGSKTGGFELTQPGLRAASDLLRKMINASSN